MKQPSEMTDRELDLSIAAEVTGVPIGVGDLLPFYSADHNAMADVLEKIIVNFPGVQITRVTDLNRTNPEWAVNFNDPDTTGAYSYNKFLPRAVAEAAVLAVRAGKEST